MEARGATSTTSIGVARGRGQDGRGGGGEGEQSIGEQQRSSGQAPPTRLRLGGAYVLSLQGGLDPCNRDVADSQPKHPGGAASC